MAGWGVANPNVYFRSSGKSNNHGGDSKTKSDPKTKNQASSSMKPTFPSYVRSSPNSHSQPYQSQPDHSQTSRTQGHHSLSHRSENHGSPPNSSSPLLPFSATLFTRSSSTCPLHPFFQHTQPAHQTLHTQPAYQDPATARAAAMSTYIQTWEMEWSRMIKDQKHNSSQPKL